MPLNTVYALERFVWRRYGDRWLALPGADPVQTFDDRATAESTARAQEWALRRRVNPFQFGGPFLHYQSAFDAVRLFDWCMDYGLEPPAVTNDSVIWSAWWEAQQPSFSNRQRAAIWEALDRVRFYRVVESNPVEAMYLVALPHFENDPIPSMGWPERYVGCTPYMMVRSRNTADGLCHDLYLEHLIETGDYTGAATEGDPWLIPEVDPFNSEELADPPLGPAYRAERQEFAFIGDHPPTPGREVFVVLRRGWRIKEGGANGSWQWSRTQARSCGRAVAAYGTLAAADAHMGRLEAEARQYPSPFRFGPALEWSTLNGSTIYGVLFEMVPFYFTNQWRDYDAADREWIEWWDKAFPLLTDLQIETAWCLFESLKFYEVVAVEYRD